MPGLGGEWMSGKFAMVRVLLLAGLTTIGIMGYAQQPANVQGASDAPATQATAGQQSDSAQENPQEESSSRRRTRPRDYSKWTFNVGGGANLPRGTSDTFIKSGGLLGTAGVARNTSKYLGLRLDIFGMNFPLRDSALLMASAPGGRSALYGLTLGPVINIPVTRKYSGYVVIGAAFYHRDGKLDSSTALPGSACNPFWVWWGRCNNTSIPLNGNFLKSSQNAFGLDFGGGVARKVHGNIEIYAEYRLMHGSHNNITTDTRPIMVGVRW